ncbi:DUF4440 domain-containing protein [Thalassovita mediterranea]|nr:DUF4440 domain-containing protein [Thalassovita mediterranea]
MKSISAAALLAAVFLSGCQTLPPEISTIEHAEIEAASAAWVEAYNANDWEALAELFTEDAILMPPNDPAVVGREAIAAWEAENETGFRIVLDIENISGSGDTAYVRGRSCLFIPQADGSYGVDAGKFLEVRKLQENGDWLLDVDIFNSNAPAGSELLDACPFAESWE